MKEEQLAPKRELFCELYTSNDREMFGNGVQSYIEAYNPDTSEKNWYKTACSSASQILSNIKVINRINELLEQQGFNDENVEKQHLFILNQHNNIPAKMKAIDSYYKLTGKNKEPEKTIVVQPIINLKDYVQRDLSHEKDNSTKEED